MKKKYAVPLSLNLMKMKRLFYIEVKFLDRNTFTYYNLYYLLEDQLDMIIESSKDEKTMASKFKEDFDNFNWKKYFLNLLDKKELKKN